MTTFWLSLQCRLEASDRPAIGSGVRRGGRSVPAEAAAPDWLGLWALQFSPQVSRREDAWLVDASACLRLWGGPAGLLSQLRSPVDAAVGVPRPPLQVALGPTPLSALSMARVRQWATPDGALPPPERLLALPLNTLSALRPWEAVWRQLGIRTWGHLHRLPRDGLARRWGPQPRAVLDRALGLLPDPLSPLVPPDVFDQTLAWDARVVAADALLEPAQRLLAALSGWLAARQRAATALRWTWRHDRLRGGPESGHIDVQSARPRADAGHWLHLTRAHLGRCRLEAPVEALRLQTLAHQPWSAPSADWLHTGPQQAPWPVPDLDALAERLQARLGPNAVLHWRPGASHWPEGLQHPALGADSASEPRWASGPGAAAASVPPSGPLPLQPTWCLAQPQALRLQGNRPCHHGPLDLLAGPHRLEWAHWPGAGTSNQATRTAPSAWPGSDSDRSVTLRDYFVARSPGAGLLWVFRDPARGGWFLHGWFA